LPWESESAEAPRSFISHVAARSWAETTVPDNTLASHKRQNSGFRSANQVEVDFILIASGINAGPSRRPKNLLFSYNQVYAHKSSKTPFSNLLTTNFRDSLQLLALSSQSESCGGPSQPTGAKPFRRPGRTRQLSRSASTGSMYLKKCDR
jgi:hypothetical protein